MQLQIDASLVPIEIVLALDLVVTDVLVDVPESRTGGSKETLKEI